MTNVLVLGCGNPSARAFTNCIKGHYKTFGYDSDPLLLAASNVDVRITDPIGDTDLDRLLDILAKHQGFSYIQPQTQHWADLLVGNQDLFSDLITVDPVLIDSSFIVGDRVNTVLSNGLDGMALILQQVSIATVFDPSYHPDGYEDSISVTELSCFPESVEFLKELGLNYPLYHISEFINERIRKFFDRETSKFYDGSKKTPDENISFNALSERLQTMFVPLPDFSLRDTHVHTWVRGMDHLPVHLISPSRFDLEKITPERVRESLIEKGIIVPENIEPDAESGAE